MAEEGARMWVWIYGIEAWEIVANDDYLDCI